MLNVIFRPDFQQKSMFSILTLICLKTFRGINILFIVQIILAPYVTSHDDYVRCIWILYTVESAFSIMTFA